MLELAAIAIVAVAIVATVVTVVTAVTMIIIALENCLSFVSARSCVSHYNSGSYFLLV